MIRAGWGVTPCHWIPERFRASLDGGWELGNYYDSSMSLISSYNVNVVWEASVSLKNVCASIHSISGLTL
ncbi:unnamed protein product [Brassica napus]|uniref:(rape) hypothetical protein n=1 Tax=Brassica napus TaxID=3708 RepID=A0A816TGN6_BRANA|nr:unnamed protein product [Brassica napus]